VEHRLLGRVLRAVVEADNLPAEVLVGSLIEEARYVEVALAEPNPSRLRPHDLWSALGTPPRTSFELVVTAPLRPTPITEIAPPAETISLGVSKEPRPPAASAAGMPPAGAGPGPGRQKRPSKATEHPAPAVPTGTGAKRWTTFRIRENEPSPADPGAPPRGR
jgi:hypothetical protein